MSEKRSIIDPNETILWRGTPDKKAFILPALIAIPFVLTFAGFFYLIITLEMPTLEYTEVVIIPVAIALIIVPVLWQYRKLPAIEYIITNQRLIIHKGFTEPDEFVIYLDEIKEIIVKIGLFDKILGTGSIFPITDLFPYEPGKYPAPQSKHNAGVIEAYNLVEKKYEKVHHIVLWEKSKMHPRLEGVKEPFVVEKLLKSAMSGEATQVICIYCYTLYDLDKEGKCPHCGGTQPQDYSTV